MTAYSHSQEEAEQAVSIQTNAGNNDRILLQLRMLQRMLLLLRILMPQRILILLVLQRKLLLQRPLLLRLLQKMLNRTLL